MTVLEYIGVIKPHPVVKERLPPRRPLPPPPPLKCNGLACCIRGTCDRSKP